jgi:hypothetical protein
MIKLLIFANLISIVWLVPNYKRFESINKIYANIDKYVPATFTVSNHFESPRTRTRNQIDYRYLSGEIQIVSSREVFTNEKFDINTIYKKGEFKKAYPLGTQLSVQFNSNEKDWENGQSMRVQANKMKISKAEIEEKRIRFAKITFGPLVISIFSFLLYLFGMIFMRKNSR